MSNKTKKILLDIIPIIGLYWLFQQENNDSFDAKNWVFGLIVCYHSLIIVSIKMVDMWMTANNIILYP